MDAVPSSWLIAAGAIVASLIAGLFSFFSLILSKEQKISEFRQSWIDDFRGDVATYISSLYALEYIIAVHNSKDTQPVEISKDIYEPYLKMNTSLNLLLLRLNSKVGNKSKAESALAEKLNVMKNLFTRKEYQGAIELVSELQKEAQSVLVAEWNRVKQGEKTFRVSKNFALMVLICTFFSGGYFIFKSQSQSERGEVENGRPVATQHYKYNSPFNQKILQKSVDNNEELLSRLKAMQRKLEQIEQNHLILTEFLSNNEEKLIKYIVNIDEHLDRHLWLINQKIQDVN